MRSFAKIKPSRKFPNLQYVLVCLHLSTIDCWSVICECGIFWSYSIYLNIHVYSERYPWFILYIAALEDNRGDKLGHNIDLVNT